MKPSVQDIFQYFPNLSTEQQKQFEALDELYRFWNAQINVISRKDLDNFYTRHVLHSLAIAKVCQFKNECSILDIANVEYFNNCNLV